jgi:hypothetical protein
LPAKRAIRLAAVALLLGWWWVAHVRSPPVAAPSASAPAPSQPAAAKVPASVIIGHIEARPNRFDLSTAAIIRLARAGVPGPVIEAMHRTSGQPAGQVH